MLSRRRKYFRSNNQQFVQNRAARCKLGGKELENSERSGTAPDSLAVFLCPYSGTLCDLLCREAAEYNTRKGNQAGRLRSVFYLPTPLVAALENVSARVIPQTQETHHVRSHPLPQHRR